MPLGHLCRVIPASLAIGYSNIGYKRVTSGKIFQRKAMYITVTEWLFKNMPDMRCYLFALSIWKGLL
jgi:hypothetical protein